MRYDSRGILATGVFHAILILFLIFMGFKTPLPLPAERGFIIDFGFSESGKGMEEPPISTTRPVVEQIPEISKVEETYVTQDIEEAPSLPVKKEVRKETKPVTEKIIKEDEKKKEEKIEERKPNPLTMYKGTGKTSADKGEGEGDKEGNQGDEEGIEGGSHFIGTSGGMGVADVGGRIPSNLPDPEYNFQKEGIVVVKVRVDRSGKVVYALPGVKGSTTLETYLLEAAKKAALSSKFDAKYDGEMYNEGTITYRFKLK